MLPELIASILLFVSGVWWGTAVLVWMYWERYFETAGRRKQRTAERDKPTDLRSTLEDILLFGLPAVLTIGLGLDGLLGTRVAFYAAGWTIAFPGAELVQVVGAVLVYAALPLFTSGAYLTGRYVYSRLPEERILMERGPYAHVRHPIYLAFVLLGIGWFLLALNALGLPLLLMLQALAYPNREEPELVKLYGDAYGAYQRHTGRFLPRLRKRS